MAKQVCYGCGARAEAHPVVAVMHRQDVAAGTKVIDLDRAHPWVGVPVCDACHRDPAHRTAHAMKAHFHEVARSRHGILLAGSSQLGG